MITEVKRLRLKARVDRATSIAEHIPADTEIRIGEKSVSLDRLLALLRGAARILDGESPDAIGRTKGAETLAAFRRTLSGSARRTASERTRILWTLGVIGGFLERLPGDGVDLVEADSGRAASLTLGSGTSHNKKEARARVARWLWQGVTHLSAGRHFTIRSERPDPGPGRLVVSFTRERGR